MPLNREAPVSTCPGQLPRLRDLYSGPQEGWAGSESISIGHPEDGYVRDDTRFLTCECEGHFGKTWKNQCGRSCAHIATRSLVQWTRGIERHKEVDTSRADEPMR